MNSLQHVFDFMTPTEQFRITRLQVYNWGTFSGLHDLKISEKGFLFLGGSGSGKTTLLDGISAILVPPAWIDFNAAARDATHKGRDRSWVTYIRGAWGEQNDDDSGEIVTRFLRKGTTWSALALTFRSTQDRIITLVKLMWIRGNSTASTDVRRQHIIFERSFDLAEFKDFDLDLRRLKQALSDGTYFENFNPYRERFGRLLGIANEKALRLLHKTQSAKNLEDLNTFLRDFMLDRPATFDVAEQLVSEFAELNQAHQAVVTARNQVETLRPARDQHGRMLEIRSESAVLDELINGIDLYTASVRKSLLEVEIDRLTVQITALVGLSDQQTTIADNHDLALRDLKDRHHNSGGDKIEQLGAEKDQKEKHRKERLGKQAQAQLACQKLDWPVPQSPEEFAQHVGRARRELDARPEEDHWAKIERDEKVQKRNELAKDLHEVSWEIGSLRRQPSNIPHHMLELRHSLADKLGLADDVLPFVGELLEVAPEEVDWQGAIERVLHGFALSILVQERNFYPLSKLVNETHLGNRLTYHRTDGEFTRGKPLFINSLPRKLKIKEGVYHDWLEAELKSRFNFACVESAQALRQTERGLTRQGLVRNVARHDKDDRHPIDDRRYWVLGFDNREKLALFERQAQELERHLSDIEGQIKAIDRRDAKRGERALHCNTLANMRWEELDVEPIVARIAAIIDELETLRTGNDLLAHLAHEIEMVQQRLKESRELLRETQNQLRDSENQRKKWTDELKGVVSQLADGNLTGLEMELLASRFQAAGPPATLEKLSDLSRQVERKLTKDRDQLSSEIGQLVRCVEKCFLDFKQRWPAESADLDATLASAQGFLEKLNRLEVDGLPQYEERFFDLLKEQSNQNLASLSTELRQARNEIRERMELVNESLKHADFNVGTLLRIEVSDRSIADVQEFKTEVNKALSHAWIDNREIAEDRFKILSKLVARLSSQDPQEKRWREVVLDVRQHVEFLARELDRDGRDVEIYRSGAGKSGGQRQKLATTCLAAALKYQLGGSEHEVPAYAAVVLDEAFDKADPQYTKMAMEVFKKLGFQMIVATPLKSVMTLEPFIGGACFVDIKDRQRSGVMLIEYDEEASRLDLPEQSHAESIAVS